jgi:hypothetical protein
MPDHKEGKIYTIRCKTYDTLLYVGCTTRSLCTRMAKHRNDYIYRPTVSFYQHVDDWDNWYIESYENFPCDSKEQSNKREGQVIREIGTLNKNIAGRKKYIIILIIKIRYVYICVYIYNIIFNFHKSSCRPHLQRDPKPGSLNPILNPRPYGPKLATVCLPTQGVLCFKAHCGAMHACMCVCVCVYSLSLSLSLSLPLSLSLLSLARSLARSLLSLSQGVSCFNAPLWMRPSFASLHCPPTPVAYIIIIMINYKWKI